MNEQLNGHSAAARVVGSSGGAAVKRYFKIDTIKFSWVDAFLRDRAIRNEIHLLRVDIDEILKFPIHRDELKTMFTSALAEIKSARLAWFVDNLKAAQARTGSIANSETLKRGNYIPPVELSAEDIDFICAQLPEGVKQTHLETEAQRLREEISRQEKVIADELSPPSRWIYRDDGKPEPYPQGCRWTQYVLAWELVASRFQGPVGVEGEKIRDTDGEMMAYTALGLDKIMRIPPLRNPL